MLRDGESRVNQNKRTERGKRRRLLGVARAVASGARQRSAQGGRIQDSAPAKAFGQADIWRQPWEEDGERSAAAPRVSDFLCFHR